MLILPLLMLFQAPDADAYDAMLTCAAFHAIEADRLTRDEGAAAGDTQRALSNDFKFAAGLFLPGDELARLEPEFDKRQTAYRDELAAGEPREMAEQWTALELACAELYPALAGLEQVPVTGAASR